MNFFHKICNYRYTSEVTDGDIILVNGHERLVMRTEEKSRKTRTAFLGTHVYLHLDNDIVIPLYSKTPGPGQEGGTNVEVYRYWKPRRY